MTNIDSVTLEQALETLGQLLLDRRQCYEVVAIGGGSLLLLGQIVRTTKDLDLVAIAEDDRLVSASPLPAHLDLAARDVGEALGLGPTWLNAGPSSLFEMGLPSGFKSRMHTRHYGSLTLHLSGRLDQIFFKLYAAVDQGPSSKHMADLKLLKPTLDELVEAGKWCRTHDVSDAFASELSHAIQALKELNALS